jgi:hypothetical protein
MQKIKSVFGQNTEEENEETGIIDEVYLSYLTSIFFK